MSHMTVRGIWAVLLIFGLTGTVLAAPPSGSNAGTTKAPGKSAGGSPRQPASANPGAASQPQPGKSAGAKQKSSSTATEIGRAHV